MDGSQSTALWRSFRNGDFEEQDVWNVLSQRTASKISDSTLGDSISESPFRPSASRMIPRRNGGNIQNPHRKSAPRSIPQWFGTSKGKMNPREARNDDSGGDYDGDADDLVADSEEEEEEEEFGAERVPPHELIARREISSFSVLEGAGRTLKGRDLSKVRNAVLTKTGFLESL